MADSILGLLFEINADPSNAQAALAAFEQSTGKSFEKAAGATKPLDTALLSNRESVRLLSEELGIHMPRAVSGALAEMLPAISAIGPALLGVFAIEEIPKLVSGIKEAVQSWEGFGKAEREAMKKAIDDTATLHGKVVDVEKELALFGKSEAEQAAMRAGWAKQDSDNALKSLQTAEGKVKDINAQIAEAKRGAGAFAAGAGGAYEGALKVAQAKVKELQEAWALANDQFVLAQKRAAEAAAEQAKHAADAQEKSENKSLALTERVQATKNRLQLQNIRAMQEAGQVAKQLAADEDKENKALYEQGQFMEKMAREDAAWLPLRQRSVDLARQEVQVLTADTTAVKHLSAAYSEYLLLKQDANNVSRAFLDAMKNEVQAVNDDMLGGMKNLAEGAVALTGSQKAAAAFKVGYETAEGLACLASGTWPPNPAAIVAAGIHFEAAAQYALSSGGGGGGGHHSSTSGGSTGGNQSDYSGGPGGGSGAGGGGGGGRGPTITLNQYGPMVGTMNDLAKALVNTINQLGTSGQVRLTAYNALTNGAKQT